MANLTKSNGNFQLTITNASQEFTDTLYTDGKVIVGDIDISVTAKSGSSTTLTVQPSTSTYPVDDTITPSSSAKYIRIDEGYLYNKQIVIAAAPPSETTTLSVNRSGTFTPSSPYVGYSSVSVPSGSYSASATKGSRDNTNKCLTVTPTATIGSAGYISSGSANGTGITVSASDVCYGTMSEITANGTYTCTGYTNVVVNIPAFYLYATLS